MLTEAKIVELLRPLPLEDRKRIMYEFEHMREEIRKYRKGA